MVDEGKMSTKDFLKYMFISRSNSILTDIRLDYDTYLISEDLNDKGSEYTTGKAKRLRDTVKTIS